MARMIDQLLDFTRIRQGQGIPLRRGPVDLAKICALALDELERPGANGRASVELLGDASGSWDGDRLMQLLSNLVGNALVHGAQGTPVVVRIDGSRPMVRLEVCNAGAVPEDVLPFLFQPMQGGGERLAARAWARAGPVHQPRDRGRPRRHHRRHVVGGRRHARDRHAAAPLIDWYRAAMSGSQAPTSTRRGPSLRPSSEPSVSSYPAASQAAIAAPMPTRRRDA